MDTILIDLKFLKKQNLTINEYLVLVKLYALTKNSDIPYTMSAISAQRLKDRRLVIKNDEGRLIPTPEGEALMEGRDFNIKPFDLFEKFYEIFPHKVPDGHGGYRPVSTLGINSNSAAKTRDIWRRYVRADQESQRHVIECLQAELEYRENNNSLQYLHNIDTWLRQSTWEKWEYLLHSQDNLFDMKDNVTRI